MFPSDLNYSCINFSVHDDHIALEQSKEFIWTLDPIPIPGSGVNLTDINSTTTLVIIDDDSKLKQSL